jgi:nucleoporin NUP159
MNTISKMTSLVEKKSGDIDVLESQMRKLRFSSVNSNQSREGSPARYSTPQKMYSSPMRTPGSGAQLFFTPQSRFSTPSRFGYSRGSPSPYERESTPVRKKLNGITTEDVHRSRNKLAARKKVVEQLREAVTKTGAHIRTVDY